MIDPVMLGQGLALAAGYLLGSIPSAIWICKLFYRTDITKVGSGNPGMTNVLRTLGWKPALPVALLDAGKGLVAAWLGLRLGGSVAWGLAAGAAAVLGHSFTCFASFRGGKGVLTGWGIFLFFTPASALASLAVWAAVVAASRYVSLGSIAGSLVLPGSILLEARLQGKTGLAPILSAAVLVCAFVLFRHRDNMLRLIRGTENKIGGSTS